MIVSDLRPDIWRLQAQLDTQGLIEALSNADPSIRKRAATALRALGATHAVPALTAALAQEQDPDVRGYLVTAIDQLAEEQQDKPTTSPEQTAQNNKITALISQLSSTQPNQIIAAARELGELKEKLAVEPLVMVFNNHKLPANVRLVAAQALLMLESAPAEVALLAALRNSDWRIRRNAAAILAQLRADWAVEPLGKALNDDNDLLRRTARAALKHIGTPEARHILKAHPAGATTPEQENADQILLRVTTKTTPAAPSSEPADKKRSKDDLRAALMSAPKPEAMPPKPAPAKPAPQPPVETKPAPAHNKPDAPPASSEPATAPPSGKLVWPKKNRIPPATVAPTRPLDPKTLENFEKKLDDVDKKPGDKPPSS